MPFLTFRSFGVPNFTQWVFFFTFCPTLVNSEVGKMASDYYSNCSATGTISSLPSCIRAVPGQTFSLTVVTAFLFCICLSTVELEVISHDHPMLRFLSVFLFISIVCLLEPLESWLWTAFNSAVKLLLPIMPQAEVTRQEKKESRWLI